MTYYKSVSFGATYASLATVGYRLYNADGTAYAARVTAGVAERPAGSGTYGASIVIPDTFTGELRWDTGGGSPKYASEALDPTVWSTLRSVLTDPLTIGGYIKAQLAKVLGGTTTMPAIVNLESDVTVFYGYDYLAAQGRQLTWTSDEWPDLTSADSASMVDVDGVEIVEVEITTAGEDDQLLTAELTRDQIALLGRGIHRYQLSATFDEDVIILVQGRLEIL